MRYIYALILIALAIPAAAAEKSQLLIIVEEIGIYTKCANQEDYPYNCTQHELDAQEIYQDRKTNFIGLKGQLMRKHGWLVDGPWTDIINEEKGVQVSKSGKTYRAFWFPMSRFEMDKPTAWAVAKIQTLKGTWDFRAHATDDAKQELEQRGYVRVESEG